MLRHQLGVFSGFRVANKTGFCVVQELQDQYISFDDGVSRFICLFRVRCSVQALNEIFSGYLSTLRYRLQYVDPRWKVKHPVAQIYVQVSEVSWIC